MDWKKPSVFEDVNPAMYATLEDKDKRFTFPSAGMATMLSLTYPNLTHDVFDSRPDTLEHRSNSFVERLTCRTSDAVSAAHPTPSMVPVSEASPMTHPTPTPGPRKRSSPKSAKLATTRVKTGRVKKTTRRSKRAAAVKTVAKPGSGKNATFDVMDETYDADEEQGGSASTPDPSPAPGLVSWNTEDTYGWYRKRYIDHGPAKFRE
ncbi:hypothetical protein LTR36_005674 [Oleoguttula mirabilis]|uniref:Uncharacterized protein n=1 Tax=Oleoguttula mirabilis TaxID=1507867 RepID=A0AAV9JDY2_9PEZI|nr:hypothetical protein LTR36_005674 [Oleoguttula mirabilis]